MLVNCFKSIVLAVLFISSTLLTGCFDELFADEEPNSQGFKLPPDFQQAADNVPEKVSVDVYWDATYSMQGYTTLAAGNVYRTLPDLLSDIGNSMGELKNFKFGETIQPLEGREYRNFSSPTPYNEVITAVHNVIDKADKSHLSIIITDLFESDADWSNVTQKLRDKYFAQHQAVAIIGIKNSFNGDIFDVGLNAAKFNYNSYDYPNKFRPFYMLVIGSEPSVCDFLERFKERQTLPNDTGYLLLSENLNDTTNDFTKLKVSGMENFFAEDKLNISDKHVKELGIDNFTSQASISLTFKYSPKLGSCPLDMSAMTTKAQVLSLKGEEWQAKEENDVSVELTPVDGEENTYTAKITLTPEKSLIESEINFIHVTIAPTAKGYKLPDWVKTWNMANVDVDPDSFDGSKTINLIHVLGSLKDSVYATSHPALLNVNLVVDSH